MAETETEQIMEGIEPPPAETAPEATEADPVAAAADDVTTDAAAEPAEPEPAPEPIVETANPGADLKLATDALTELTKQQADLDAEFEAIEKQVADGTLEAFDASTRVQLLTARAGRLEKKVKAATEAVAQQQEQREEHIESHWKGLATKYADIADTPEKVTETIKTLWDEEYNKAVKENPNMHPERIAGKAEAGWEQRIAVLRAQAGTTRPSSRPSVKPPGRLTPGTGSVPMSPGKEKGAVVAERTLGPLSQYKF